MSNLEFEKENELRFFFTKEKVTKVKKEIKVKREVILQEPVTGYVYKLTPLSKILLASIPIVFGSYLLFNQKPLVPGVQYKRLDSPMIVNNSEFNYKENKVAKVSGKDVKENTAPVIGVQYADRHPNIESQAKKYLPQPDFERN